MLEGAHAAFLGAPRLFPSPPFPSKARSWDLIRSEACAWQNDMLIISVRLKDEPSMFSPRQMFHRTVPTPRGVYLFLKPGFRHVNNTVLSGPKAELRFYLNGGNNHPSDCCKVLLPSGHASYTCDVTWSRSREAFMGSRQPTAGGRVNPPPSPPENSPAVGVGSINASPPLTKTQSRMDVWCRPSLEYHPPQYQPQHEPQQQQSSPPLPPLPSPHLEMSRRAARGWKAFKPSPAG